jgi:hypothetical protein
MSVLKNRFFRKIKERLVQSHPYVSLKYWEYYVSHPGGGVKENLKKVLKILQLNMQAGKVKYKKEDLPKPEDMVRKLSSYDIVSFDIFDTLILRRVEKPVDVFAYMEAKYHIPRFYFWRIKAEERARENSKNGEVNLSEIYDVLCTWIGIDKEEGIRRELEAEYSLCIANPYFAEVYEELKKNNKRIVITSDMYLEREALEVLLHKNGYSGYEKIFVSNEHNKSKGSGELYDVLKAYTKTASVIHIGDNFISDYYNAGLKGISPYYYPNVNFPLGEQRQKAPMSILTAAFVKATLNNYLYNGSQEYSGYFQYGMVSGGLLVCAYCEYINKIAKEKNIDKILFLARDGYIINKVYEKYYNECESEYILFSRFASERILFPQFTKDYIVSNFERRHSMGKQEKVGDIFRQIDLEAMIEKLEKYDIDKDMIYTPDLYKKIEKAILSEKDYITKEFEDTKRTMEKYLAPVIEKNKNILVVDLGWFGTGGLALKHLIEEAFEGDKNVYSVLLGTNEESSIEGRVAQGSLFVYGFSTVHERALTRWHQAFQSNIHNMLLEIIFTAPAPTFLKFEEENGNLKPCFGYNEVDNLMMIEEIHSGIMKFAELYNAYSDEVKNMMVVNGENAYSGFMVNADDRRLCYELFKNYKMTKLSGIFGENTITTMGENMSTDGYM